MQPYIPDTDTTNLLDRLRLLQDDVNRPEGAGDKDKKKKGVGFEAMELWNTPQKVEKQVTKKVDEDPLLAKGEDGINISAPKTTLKPSLDDPTKMVETPIETAIEEEPKSAVPEKTADEIRKKFTQPYIKTFNEEIEEGIKPVAPMVTIGSEKLGTSFTKKEEITSELPEQDKTADTGIDETIKYLGGFTPVFDKRQTPQDIINQQQKEFGVGEPIIDPKKKLEDEMVGNFTQPFKDVIEGTLKTNVGVTKLNGDEFIQGTIQTVLGGIGLLPPIVAFNLLSPIGLSNPVTEYPTKAVNKFFELPADLVDLHFKINDRLGKVIGQDFKNPKPTWWDKMMHEHLGINLTPTPETIESARELISVGAMFAMLPGMIKVVGLPFKGVKNKISKMSAEEKTPENINKTISDAIDVFREMQNEIDLHNLIKEYESKGETKTKYNKAKEYYDKFEQGKENPTENLTLEEITEFSKYDNLAGYEKNTDKNIREELTKIVNSKMELTPTEQPTAITPGDPKTKVPIQERVSNYYDKQIQKLENEKRTAIINNRPEEIAKIDNEIRKSIKIRNEDYRQSFDNILRKGDRKIGQEKSEILTREAKYSENKSIISNALNKAGRTSMQTDFTLGLGSFAKEFSDPKVIKAIYEAGQYHFENGITKLEDWTGKLIEEFGAGIEKILPKIWEAVSIEQGFNPVTTKVSTEIRDRTQDVLKSNTDYQRLSKKYDELESKLNSIREQNWDTVPPSKKNQFYKTNAEQERTRKQMELHESSARNQLVWKTVNEVPQFLHQVFRGERGEGDFPVDYGWFSAGEYWTKNMTDAKGYMNQDGSYKIGKVTLKNPFYAASQMDLINTFRNFLQDVAGRFNKEKGRKLYFPESADFLSKNKKLKGDTYEEIRSQYYRDALEQMGYDGVVVNGGTEVVVFQPKKSITDKLSLDPHMIDFLEKTMWNAMDEGAFKNLPFEKTVNSLLMDMSKKTPNSITTEHISNAVRRASEYHEGIIAVQELTQRIRDKKMTGLASMLDFGITKTVFNSALELVAREIERGTKLGKAITKAIQWIDKQMGKEWNKNAFAKHLNESYTVKLKGEKIEVKEDISLESVELVNGFYSSLEQGILNTKFESLTGKEWDKKLSGTTKKDELVYTGIKEFLTKNADKQISKKELKDYIQDNRIQIIEKVNEDKFGEKWSDNLAKEEYLNEKLYDISEEIKMRGYQIFGSLDGIQIAKSNDINYTLLLKDLPPKVQVLAREYERIYIENSTLNQPVHYPELQVKGNKSNYKEILITMPSEINKKVGSFVAGHFGGELNLIAHIRMNTRVDVNGKRVLFLEEIQSDWGQKGKKGGFQKYKQEDLIFVRNDTVNAIKGSDGAGHYNILDKKSKERLSVIYGNNGKDAIQNFLRTNTISLAPFVTDTNAWVQLALKVALKEAAKQNVDKIAWTTGEQQSARYDLSKQVNEIRYSNNGDNTYNLFGIKNREPVFKRVLEKSKLENYIGKEITKKILNNEGNFDNSGKLRRLSGVDLKIGGKGMEGFYGNPAEGKLGIVGEVAKSLTGQEVKTTEITINPNYGGIQNAPHNNRTQHSIEITPEIKGAVESGISLFGDLKYNLAKATIKKAFNESAISFNGLGTLADIVNPKVLKAVYDIGKFHFESGKVKLLEWGDAIIKDVGVWVKKHLDELWKEVKKWATTEHSYLGSKGLGEGLSMNLPPPKGHPKALFIREKIRSGKTFEEASKLWEEKTEKVKSIIPNEQLKKQAVENNIDKNIYKFDDPNIEKRYANAHGLKKDRLWVRIKDVATLSKNRITRVFPHLPVTGQFAIAKNELIKLQKQRDIAAEQTIKDLMNITSELDPVKMGLFERKVLLDDLTYELKEGRDLPFGFDATTLTASKQKIDGLVQLDPIVTEALNKRKTLTDSIKDEYGNIMEDIGFNVRDRFKNESYYRHQVLQYAKGLGLHGTGKKLRTPSSRGFLKKREGSELDINTNYVEAEFEVLSQMRYDIEVARTIREIKNEYDIMDRLKAEAKEKGLDEIEIPEGYVEWRPRDGNLFYHTYSIPEKVATDIMFNAVKTIDPTVINDAMSIGQKHPAVVIPRELAKTLDNLKTHVDVEIYQMVLRKPLDLWKQWQLLSPFRFFKYNFRNLTGDLDGVIATYPSALKYIFKAGRELLNIYSRKKDISPEANEYIKHGGKQSTLVANDIADLIKLPEFKNIVEKKSWYEGNVPLKMIDKYWGIVKTATNFREAVLRYSVYLERLEHLEKNNGVPKSYGASLREEVNALKTNHDKAYKMSNDALGAYDEVGLAGQTVSRYLMPFYRWNEVNLKRYKRVFANAIIDGKIGVQMGKTFGGMLIKSPYMLYRLGVIGTKATFLWSVIQAFNNLVFPDIEDELQEDVRSKPHINLGRNSDGTVRVFTQIGALGDFLSWFGVDDFPKQVSDLLRSKTTLKELAEQWATAPIKKLVQGLTPYGKIPIELLFVKGSLYPNPFKPRPIRDVGLYISQQFGVDNEYKVIKGLPRKKYYETLSNFFYYNYDPKQNAYFNILAEKTKFRQSIGKTETSGVFEFTDKSNALYNYKLALRLGDKELGAKFLQQFYDLGGTDKGLYSTLSHLNPVYGLDFAEQEKFKEWMDEGNKRDFAKALIFYNDIINESENLDIPGHTLKDKSEKYKQSTEKLIQLTEQAEDDNGNIKPEIITQMESLIDETGDLDTPIEMMRLNKKISEIDYKIIEKVKKKEDTQALINEKELLSKQIEDLEETDEYKQMDEYKKTRGIVNKLKAELIEQEKDKIKQ